MIEVDWAWLGWANWTPLSHGRLSRCRARTRKRKRKEKRAKYPSYFWPRSEEEKVLQIIPDYFHPSNTKRAVGNTVSWWNYVGCGALLFVNHQGRRCRPYTHHRSVTQQTSKRPQNHSARRLAKKNKERKPLSIVLKYTV